MGADFSKSGPLTTPVDRISKGKPPNDLSFFTRKKRIVILFFQPLVHHAFVAFDDPLEHLPIVASCQLYGIFYFLCE